MVQSTRSWPGLSLVFGFTPSTVAEMSSSVRLYSGGPAQTKELAAALAVLLVSGDLVILDGDLGAGKTCFTQGLAAGLGVVDPVTSPTFSLVNCYSGRLLLYHLDVYRLDGPADAIDLDIDEMLEDGVTVVEWGDRVASALPADRFTVSIRFPGEGDDPPGAVDSESDVDDCRWIEITGPLSRPGLLAAVEPWRLSPGVGQ